ncbi:MAG: Grx4 family monothiol glutaredoxin [Myxococcales bacterium]|nr:Grx4 family monothiol glutaredoxin [Myxococcales bacterium]
MFGQPETQPPPPRPRPTFAPDAEAEPAEEPSARGGKPVGEFIAQFVKENQVVLFMKGSPSSPQCGFSASAAGILANYGKPIAHVNVLADPDVRDAVKQFTSWPTIPQVFIGGEFVGGSDILKAMHEAGDLKAMFAKLP